MAIPPAPEVPCASELMPPESMQMIEKDTAKLEKRLNRRSSSCAYPMLWRTFTSSFLSTSVYPDADTSAMSHPYVAGLNGYRKIHTLARLLASNPVLVAATRPINPIPAACRIDKRSPFLTD